MPHSSYRLNDNHSMAFPVVGDAEIRSIEFEHPHVRINIFQPFDGTYVDLFLTGMRFLFFHTDLAQNVIERVFVYTSWETARFPSEVDPEVLKKEFGSTGRYIVVIDSIAGGPLVCGAQDLSIRTKGPADSAGN